MIYIKIIGSDCCYNDRILEVKNGMNTPLVFFLSDRIGLPIILGGRRVTLPKGRKPGRGDAAA